MAERRPIYGLSSEQEDLFFNLVCGFRRLGYVVLSEPVEGLEEKWLDALRRNLSRIETRLSEVRKAYRTRGYSRASLYYLTSCDWFDPGFGIHVSPDQRNANREFKRALDRAVTRYDASMCEIND